MARVRDFLAEFMLEHISTILEKYPISVGDYVLGQRVKCVESHGDYSFVTVGVICGFEYFNGQDFDDVGYFYQVTNEFGYMENADGSIFPLTQNKVERVAAKDVYPIDSEYPKLKVKVTV